jgi:hypothetical protein
MPTPEEVAERVEQNRPVYEAFLAAGKITPDMNFIAYVPGHGCEPEFVCGAPTLNALVPEINRTLGKPRKPTVVMNLSRYRQPKS